MTTRTILCFGDSNTHGTIPMRHIGDVRRYGPDVRWPGRLATLLAGRATIIAEGHPGRTTVHDDPVTGAHKNGLTVLPALLETHAPLDLVVIMLGTNDHKHRFAVTAQEIAASVERLALIVSGFHAGPGHPAPEVLLVSPAPIEETGFIKETFTGAAPASKALAGHLAEIADRHGFGFLDAAECARVDPLDGLHLNEHGHRALADALAAQIGAWLD
jgi:lysophospholipase L1-like esterase